MKLREQTEGIKEAGNVKNIENKKLAVGLKAVSYFQDMEY